MTDVLLINPGNSNKVYQDLSKKYSAIEPPTWSLLLAKSCQSQNFKPEIMDCNAEKLTNDQIYQGSYLQLIEGAIQLCPDKVPEEDKKKFLKAVDQLNKKN